MFQTMKDILSSLETNYRFRWISEGVKSAVKSFPAVVVTGARQVGKSTFLQHEFGDFRYVSLDDYSSLDQARKDPSSLWMGSERVIIDEAQRAPEVFSAMKLAIDRSRRKMRFIVSGSSNLLLMKGVSETLAGRAVYFEMLPMTFGEIEERGARPANFMKLWAADCGIVEGETEPINPVPAILRGHMPPLLNLKERRDVLLWWEGYVRTYLERDLRELSQIDSLIDFRRVLESLALRTGTVLNQADLSRDTRVSQPTISRYMKLLEVSNIIQRIPAYCKSRTKRITKSPKVFVVDPGLAAYLSGYHEEEALREAREMGFFFETFVFLHLKVLTALMVPQARMFYWRTTTGREVDFVIEQGRKLLAFEIKLTLNPSYHDAKGLLSFIDEHPQVVRGIIVHNGPSVRWLHSKILAVPWWWISI